VLDTGRRQAISELYQSVWDSYREQLDRAAAPNTQTRLAAASLAAADHFAAHLAEIPVHLLVCVDLGALQLTDRDLDRPSIAGGASVYPFVHNLLLAAKAEGLGAAITTLLCAREPQVRAMFKIPDGQALAALVTLGHPLRERIPKSLRRRSVEEFAFVNDFGGDPLTSSGRP
jgi:nitroreductase